MKIYLPVCASLLLLTPLISHASPVLMAGTPGNSLLATPTGPSPNLHGVLINFDNLTPFSTLPSDTASGVTISSPDGFVAEPFSTQSFPIELFDNSSNGTANTTITVAGGVSAIGVGIADSDPVTITLQALGAGGVALGSSFAVTIPENTVNPGNGYFVVQDTTADIFGLHITQSVGSANFSGLAIDDVQDPTPEPSTFLLVAAGALLIASSRVRKRA